MMRKKIGIKDITKEEAVWPGNPACQGCAGSLVGRLVFKALGRNSARVEVASCAPGFMNIRVPSFYAPAFEGAAAFLTGLSRGYKLIGREDIVVAGLIGDGGTVDIGFQGLSAAAERNENIFFFTYDNEAYMNTGGQRSSATPFLARTATTPISKTSRGKMEEKKNVPMIIALHRVPYVATASVAYPEDLMEKITYAKEIKGFKFMHINAPCPTGWGVEPKDSIKVARLSVESGGGGDITDKANVIIRKGAASVTITNSTITNSSGYGVLVKTGASGFAINQPASANTLSGALGGYHDENDQK